MDFEQLKQQFNFWWSEKSYWFYKNVLNHDLIWWVRYRIEKEHAYHIVDLNLNPSYYEVQTRMEVAVFELMKEFVEAQLVHMNEKWWNYQPTPDETMFDRGVKAIVAHRDLERDCNCTHLDENTHKERVEYYVSLLEVYRWFHENRSLVVDGSFSPVDGEDWEERELAFNAELETQMIKTIQLRTGMWT